MRASPGGVRGRVGVVLVLLVAAVASTGQPGSQVAAQAAPSPTPNPTIAESCGVDVTLVLDASGSISSSDAVEDVRDAADAFLDALRNTNSSARVTQFASASQELAPLTLVDDASLASGGVLAAALSDYYDPIPPAPPGRVFRRFSSGNPQSASSWGAANTTSNQYTNWDQALGDAQTPADLVVFVTDGDPTAYDLDEAGDPFDGNVIGYNTNTGQAAAPTINRAVAEANLVKAAGRRMLAIGVGAALGSAASQQRLQQVSGPQIVQDADLAGLDSLNDVDVALVTDFRDLAQFLRSVVLQLCSPSLTIRKLAQSPTEADYLPAGGWDLTVAPDTPTGDFTWILPDTAPAPSKSVVTDAEGFAQFQWEPDPPEQDSTATVTEDVQPGFLAGRPDGDDYRCEARDEDGDARIVAGELVPSGGTAQFLLDPIGQEIVTCTVWNSFAYAPAIGVTKVNDPEVVRGDLDPPAVVTSTYRVTNEGNTPLSVVSITDDTCAAVTPVLAAGFNVGDVNRNDLLDVPETWTYTCAEPVRVSRTSSPIVVTNTVTVVGVDPTGTAVEDTATDTVTVYVPGLALEKLVNGEPAVTIAETVPPTAVTYTYRATNTGNTAFEGVVLTDDTPPCEAPARGPDDPGNGDDVLDPGEVWTWSCTAAPAESVVNTAVVTATPQVPGGGELPDPNPPLTAEDTAVVEVVNPNISLTKAATPTVVVLDPEPGASEIVTYTFEATNTITATPAVPLNRPGAATGGPSAREPGWITDERCTAPATYVGGDTDDDELLDPGETWTFTCEGVVTERTINEASIVGQPSDATGAPLPGVDPVTDEAYAIVTVLQPAIEVHKTALDPVVLDPAAEPDAGPDAPDVRPARYAYDVVNTGTVPLQLAADPPVDDVCAPLVAGDPNPGDSDGNGLLDVDEVWTYTCEQALSRDDGNTPTVTGAESGLVTNTVIVGGVPSVDGTTFPDKAVEATDQAQVTVIEPALTLTKTPSAPAVLVDGDVTYTFTVANTGDVALDLIGPADDKCAPVEYVSGDANGNGLLDGANSAAPETWTFTCTRAVPAPAAGDTTDVNTATVTGIDPLGNTYDETATAEVGVLDPAIQLTKTVSDALVLNGSTVRYEFAVTNTGTSPVLADDVLAEVTLADDSDPAVPSCAAPAYVRGDDDGDGLLTREPPETWIYECSAPVTEATTDVAVVRGLAGTLLDPPLALEVSDIDRAFVQPFTPGIEVAKTASPTSVVGSAPVTYTYTVRNTGDVPLAGVAARITDDTCSAVTYVSGDEDADGLLDTPRSIFEDELDEVWTFTCTATVATTTTNTAVVTGTPADPTGTALCASPGTEPVGGQDPEPCDVVGQARATVTVTPVAPLVPGTIVVVKRTPAPTTTRFAFTFGDQRFTLGRDETRTISGVAPGTYTITEPVQAAWRLTALTCTDATGDTVSSRADRRATIVVAPGETVTCTFTNSPTAPLPSTGMQQLRTTVAIGVAALLAGAALALGTHRRRRGTAA